RVTPNQVSHAERRRGDAPAERRRGDGHPSPEPVPRLGCDEGGHGLVIGWRRCVGARRRGFGGGGSRSRGGAGAARRRPGHEGGRVDASAPAGIQVVEARARKEVAPYHFRILDSDHVGTFSQFAGYGYVNRGIFELAADEVELRFLLAREVAPVDARDFARSVAQGGRAVAITAPDPIAGLYPCLAAGGGGISG
ncbi:MAG TPA: hypothetical protein VF590_24860, partial [Isosphaeraceae bacterium]